MTPAEKIILKKALISLQSGLNWSGSSQDWVGYANQLKGTIKNVTQLVETIFELPDNSEAPLPPTNSVESQRNLNNQLDDLLP